MCILPHNKNINKTCINYFDMHAMTIITNGIKFCQHLYIVCKRILPMAGNKWRRCITSRMHSFCAFTADRCGWSHSSTAAMNTVMTSLRHSYQSYLLHELVTHASAHRHTLHMWSRMQDPIEIGWQDQWDNSVWRR